MYDVIVAGAGPAGSVVAFQLASAGARVLLLEKARLPRYKTCGGGLTIKGVHQLPFDASSAIEAVATGGVLSYRGRELARAELPKPAAWLVMRDRFDQLLAEQSALAGVELVEGAAVSAVEQDDSGVTVQAGRDKFRARLLAGADGVNSVVARAAGLLTMREVGTAIEQEVAVPDAAIRAQGNFATFDFGALPRGYGWIFPKRDHLSVGVFQATPGKTPHLRDDLARFIAGQPLLKGLKVLHSQGHRIPLGGQRVPLHNGRILVLGDAANLADPWLGEGIFYAIRSARIAAPIMLAALEAPTLDLSDYTQQIQREIVRDFRYARFIAAILYRVPGPTSGLLARVPEMQQAVFDTVRGDLSIRELNYWILEHVPQILARLVIGNSGLPQKE